MLIFEHVYRLEYYMKSGGPWVNEMHLLLVMEIGRSEAHDFNTSLLATTIEVTYV